MTSCITPGRAVSAALLCSVRFACLALTAVALLFASLPAVALAKEGESQRKTFDVPAGPAASTLKTFIAQSGVQLLYAPGEVKDVQTRAVRGEFTPDEAIGLMLAETKLVSQVADNGAISVSRALDPNVNRAIAESSQSVRPDRSGRIEFDEKGEPVVKLDTFEVFGRKTLNMGIERTQNDIQPFVVFDSEAVQNSGAINLEDFLRSRLPMNTQAGSILQQQVPTGPDQFGQRGRINLRGLGANQTLILVDGRRIPSVATGFDLSQPDINGIPTSAIERIEILPSTAGAIYGGGATGGVINVVLKKNYSGFDLAMLYGNTFRGDLEQTKLSVVGGFTTNDGKTRVTLTAARSKQGELTSADRDFAERAGARALASGIAANSVQITGRTGDITNVFSSTGANLVLKMGSPLNSPYTFVPYGYAGISGDNGAALATNAGRVNLRNELIVLMRSFEVASAGLTVRHSFNDKVEGYGDFFWDENKNSYRRRMSFRTTLNASSTSNPFLQSIVVRGPLPTFAPPTENRAENLRAVMGVTVRLPKDWNLGFEAELASNKFRSVAVLPFNLSTTTAAIQAAALRDLEHFPPPSMASIYDVGTMTVGPVRNTLQLFSLRVGGPVPSFTADPIVLSALVEHRNELVGNMFIESAGYNVPANNTVAWTPKANQEVRSGYVEARIPLFDRREGSGLDHNLEALIALRRDEYSTSNAGTSVPVTSKQGPFPPESRAENQTASTDLTVGLRYAPLNDLVFRTSYSTGFLPPSFTQIWPNFFTDVAASFPYTDPLRGGALLTGDPAASPPGMIRNIFNGNPGITPERSKSYTWGIVFEPRAIKGLRLSIDHTRIDKSDEIGLLSAQEVINQESNLPGRVVRAPKLTSDPASWSGPIVSIDTSYLNLLRTRSDSLDLKIDYERTSALTGDWRIYAIATHADKFLRQLTANTPAAEAVGYLDGPLSWRGNIGLEWKKGEWSAGWNLQWYNSYRVYTSRSSASAITTFVTVQGAERIERQHYSDLFVSFRSKRKGWLKDLDVILNIQNVFDEAPPISVPNGSGSYSFYGDPRLRRFTISFKKGFSR